MSDLNKLAKQCLGIVETATLKDDEINMLISSAKTDMKRVVTKRWLFLESILAS